MSATASGAAASTTSAAAASRSTARTSRGSSRAGSTARGRLGSGRRRGSCRCGCSRTQSGTQRLAYFRHSTRVATSWRDRGQPVALRLGTPPPGRSLRAREPRSPICRINWDINVVAAAGNTGGEVGYPGRVSGSRSPSAAQTTQRGFCSILGARTGARHLGARVRRARVARRGNGLGLGSGTSFATPVVSGALAALRAYQPRPERPQPKPSLLQSPGSTCRQDKSSTWAQPSGGRAATSLIQRQRRLGPARADADPSRAAGRSDANRTDSRRLGVPQSAASTRHATATACSTSRLRRAGLRPCGLHRRRTTVRPRLTGSAADPRRRAPPVRRGSRGPGVGRPHQRRCGCACRSTAARRTRSRRLKRLASSLPSRYVTASFRCRLHSCNPHCSPFVARDCIFLAPSVAHRRRLTTCIRAAATRQRRRHRRDRAPTTPGRSRRTTRAHLDSTRDCPRRADDSGHRRTRRPDQAE